MKDITIRGLPPSKSNTYKIITLKSKTGKVHSSLGKSKQAKEYEKAFNLQLPASMKKKNIESPFGLMVDVYFERANNDLDNPLKIILDCLQQSRVIKNDNRCEFILARKFTGYQPKINFSLLSPRAFELIFELIDLLRLKEIEPDYEKDCILRITKELKEII